MNIRYQTKMQAQKALAKSGRVFGGSLMIGVSICTDPSVHELNGSQMLDQSHANNPEASIMSLNSSLPVNRSIRPLTQSFMAAHNEHDVTAFTNTPNKNSGIVSKAMEYIFGW